MGLHQRQILSHVWGYDFVGDGRTVDAPLSVCGRNWRVPGKKQPWSIATVWGVGYKFEEHREEQGGGSKSQH